MHTAEYWAIGGSERMSCRPVFKRAASKICQILSKFAEDLPNYVKFCQIFGKFHSFSAVSAPIFARKYAFCSIFQNLPDYQAENFENWQILKILRHNLQQICGILTKIADFSSRFLRNFEIAAVQKYANLVELEKCCRTHIFLQNFVLIQPRTSPLKNCKIC